MIVTVTLNSCLHHILAFENATDDQVVIKPVRSFFSPGGKGLNAARVAVSMGGEVLALCTHGDLEGDLLLREVRYSGVPVKSMPLGRPTRISTCLYNLSSGNFTELLEPGVEFTAQEVEDYFDLFLSCIENAGIVALNGSSPCRATDAFFQRAVRAAREKGCLVVVDSYGDSLVNAIEAVPHIVKLNVDEIRLSFHKEINSEADLLAFAGLVKKKGVDSLLVTDGSKGAWIFSGEELYRLSAPRVRELHAIGSGDAMLGAILVRLAEGDRFEDACRWGAAAGAVNASKLEVCDLSREAVEGLLPDTHLKKMDR